MRANIRAVAPHGCSFLARVHAVRVGRGGQDRLHIRVVGSTLAGEDIAVAVGDLPGRPPPALEMGGCGGQRRLLAGLAQGQRHGGGDAAGTVRVQCEVAVVALEDDAAEGEPEAGAGDAEHADAGAAMEAFEDVGEFVGRDADAGVGDGDNGALVGAADESDGDVGAGVTVCDRVGDQFVDDTAQACDVAAVFGLRSGVGPGLRPGIAVRTR
jgi:hypothetical protein